MRKIGFITSAEHAHLAPDEQLLPELLYKHEIIAEPVVWDDRNVSWNNYDGFIFRSCWDYFKRIAEFEKFLEFAALENLTMYNSLETVRQNMDKHYLKQLEASGVSICPSVFLKKDKIVDLKTCMQENGWPVAVIKPTISGTAYHTYKLDLQQADDFQEKFDSLIKEHNFIMQEFFPVIESEGEKSLIFFNRKFSHAVMKKAKPGDFRVQGEFGGSVHGFTPTAEELQFAENVLKIIPEDLLYARVDFITSRNTHYLMELELFEPSLYLYNAESRLRFAAAITELFQDV